MFGPFTQCLGHLYTVFGSFIKCLGHFIKDNCQGAGDNVHQLECALSCVMMLHTKPSDISNQPQTSALKKQAWTSEVGGNLFCMKYLLIFDLQFQHGLVLPEEHFNDLLMVIISSMVNRCPAILQSEQIMKVLLYTYLI